jgi:hypothetical protein
MRAMFVYDLKIAVWRKYGPRRPGYQIIQNSFEILIAAGLTFVVLDVMSLDLMGFHLFKFLKVLPTVS